MQGMTEHVHLRETEPTFEKSPDSEEYGIHPKRWFPRFQESADNFEFSAERLSENAKSIKITLFAELLTAISPIYVQSLLNLSIKTLKHTICSTKMPHWHQILVIFMIYAIMSRNFAVRMYALFPQISLDRKTEFRRRYPFLDVWNMVKDKGVMKRQVDLENWRGNMLTVWWKAYGRDCQRWFFIRPAPWLHSIRIAGEREM